MRSPGLPPAMKPAACGIDARKWPRSRVTRHMKIASGVIQQFYKEGEPKSENERRGLKVWVVYAVLRNAVNHIDLASMVDHAGVIAAPPTIFDLAEHQDITAKVKVFKSGRIQMQITGRSALDS
jgi:hypothetical protein